MKLCQLLKIKRKCLDMSVAEFSVVCGVSPTTISNLEKGMELSEKCFAGIMTKLKDYEKNMNNEDSLGYWLRYSVECLINETNETMFEKNCDEVIFKALRLKSVKYEG